MTAALAAAIAAAEALAWLPTANLSQPVYEIRRDAAAAFLEAMRATGPVDCGAASPELRYLLAAMERAAAASYANRRGDPYYERREAIYQLRGCLAVWKAAGA